MWQDQIERGTYVTSGSIMTATPNQWSCPGPDPIANYGISFDEGNLIVTNAKAEVIVYPPQPPSDRAPPTGVIIAVGCNTSGDFVPMPLSPVEN